MVILHQVLLNDSNHKTTKRFKAIVKSDIYNISLYTKVFWTLQPFNHIFFLQDHYRQSQWEFSFLL